MTGPSALANACSTNHGSVSARSRSVAASAGAPLAVTKSSQRAGSARNDGIDSGETDRVRSAPPPESGADSMRPVASIRKPVATGPTASTNPLARVRGEPLARPGFALEHAVGEGGGGLHGAVFGDGATGVVRRTPPAGCRPAASRPTRRPAWSGSRPRRTPSAAARRPRAAVPVKRTLAQWSRPSVVTSSTSASSADDFGRLVSGARLEVAADLGEHRRASSRRPSALRSLRSYAACSGRNCSFACSTNACGVEARGQRTGDGAEARAPRRAHHRSMRRFGGRPGGGLRLVAAGLGAEAARRPAYCIAGRAGLRAGEEHPDDQDDADDQQRGSAACWRTPRTGRSATAARRVPRPAARPAIGPIHRDMPDGGARRRRAPALRGRGARLGRHHRLDAAPAGAAGAALGGVAGGRGDALALRARGCGRRPAAWRRRGRRRRTQTTASGRRLCRAIFTVVLQQRAELTKVRRRQ